MEIIVTCIIFKYHLFHKNAKFVEYTVHYRMHSMVNTSCLNVYLSDNLVFGKHHIVSFSFPTNTHFI